jgi:hypothetical protein
MGRAHWRTGSSRRTSSRKQVAHIRHPQQQRPQRHSKPKSKIFHFGFQILKITTEEEFSSNLNPKNKEAILFNSPQEKSSCWRRQRTTVNLFVDYPAFIGPVQWLTKTDSALFPSPEFG